MKSIGTIAKYIWIAGGIAVAIGEVIAAANPAPNDTISEKFKKAPKIIQYAVIFFAGATFSHFAEWRIRDAVEAAKGDS